MSHPVSSAQQVLRPNWTHECFLYYLNAGLIPDLLQFNLQASGGGASPYSCFLSRFIPIGGVFLAAVSGFFSSWGVFHLSCCLWTQSWYFPRISVTEKCISGVFYAAVYKSSKLLSATIQPTLKPLSSTSDLKTTIVQIKPFRAEAAKEYQKP